MTDELTDRQMLEALYNKFIVEGEEPEPPPGPEPGRPWALVKVIEDKCHLRAVDHLDGAGKAVWNSYPKGSDNPKRDRYLVYRGTLVYVYTDGKKQDGQFLRSPYRGAFPGTGGNHGWEVRPGQTFNGHQVPVDPKLFILCRDVVKV